MNKPLVSIIIPTFNKSILAIETLKSIAAQTYPHWECIVVDDGSTTKDFNTLQDFIKTDARFSLHQRPVHKPKGANACRNYGMCLSKGEYLQFFDSDDLMLENCLENRVKYLEKDYQDFIVFSMGILKGDNYVNDTENTNVNNWEEALHAFIGPKRLPWNLQRTMYKADLIKNKITFNEHLNRFQDVEFNIRLLTQLKPTFKILDIIDCVYRKASNLNPRNEHFYIDVYESIPKFLQIISAHMPQSVLIKNKHYLQKWLFNIVGLYTTKDVKKKHIIEVVKSAKQHLQLNWKQQLFIRVLYYFKSNSLDFKGSTKFIIFLKNNY